MGQSAEGSGDRERGVRREAECYGREKHSADHGGRKKKGRQEAEGEME